MVIDRNSKNISYPAQFGILLGLIGAGLIIGSLVSAVRLAYDDGKAYYLQWQNDMLKPQYYNAIMAMQVISTFFMFFVPVYIFALICYRRPAKFIGFNTNINYKQILLLLGILVLTFPLSGALAELNKIIPISLRWAAKFKLWKIRVPHRKRLLLILILFQVYYFFNCDRIVAWPF